MSWMFLLVVCMALCALAVVIGVMVMLFRAAAKSSSRPSAGVAGAPPILPDDSLTNPANPLYHLHHPAPFPDDPVRHQAIDPGPSPSSFNAGSLPASSDPGGSGCG